jgi:uncharacterized membrane protein
MNFDAFFAAPLVVQSHVFCALGALVIGAVQLTAPKGNLPHRTLGIAFVVLMAGAAISAIFIREINGGNFSFVHLFVPLTLIGIYRLVLAARRRDRTGHGRQALAAFFAALLIPGLFAFLPGRLMHTVFLGG